LQTFAPTDLFDYDYDSLIYSAFVAGDPQASKTLPGPWVFSISLIWIRLIWAAWAVFLATAFYKEGVLSLDALKKYWAIAKHEPPKKEEKSA
ncbi:hypothetical protein KAI87_07230, partial [Myxococcota bacterium]|nr:hypothetical protein [Myxococcota bacterium]